MRGGGRNAHRRQDHLERRPSRRRRLRGIHPALFCLILGVCIYWAIPRAETYDPSALRRVNQNHRPVVEWNYSERRSNSNLPALSRALQSSPHGREVAMALRGVDPVALLRSADPLKALSPETIARLKKSCGAECRAKYKRLLPELRAYQKSLAVRAESKTTRYR